MNIKIGIVGIGNMGNTHAMQILKNKVPGMTLSAVCDIDADKLSRISEKIPDLSVYKEYDDMINSGLDAVLICTPHCLHPEMAVKAFNKGLHVITEKPAGICAEDIFLMKDAADKADRKFAIMFNQRTDPLFIEAKRIISQGKLGNIKRMIWNVTNWYRSQAYYDSQDWRATWSGEGGGVLMNQAPHNLDIWQWLIGMPDRIKAFLSYGKYHNIEVEDDAVIYGEYKNGATAVFITSTGEYPGTNRLEISGDRGKIVLEKNKLTLSQLQISEREYCYKEENSFPNWAVETYEYEPQESIDGHIEILKNFVDSVNHNTNLTVSGEEGYNSLAITNGAYLSHWNNEWVELPLKELYRPFLTEKTKNESIKGKIKSHEELNESYSDRWKVNW